MQPRYIFTRVVATSQEFLSYTSNMYASEILAVKAMCDDADDYVLPENRLKLRWEQADTFDGLPAWIEYDDPATKRFTRWDIHTLVDARSPDESDLTDELIGQWMKWAEEHDVPAALISAVDLASFDAWLDYTEGMAPFDGHMQPIKTDTAPEWNPLKQYKLNENPDDEEVTSHGTG